MAGMKILWLCGLPRDVEREVFNGASRGSRAEFSWVLAHLPPPPDVELHIACLWPGGGKREDFQHQGAWFHLLPCPRRGRAATLFLFDHLYYRDLYNELKPDLVQAWGAEDSYGLTAVRLAGRRHVLATQGFLQLIVQRGRPCLRYRITAFSEKYTLRRIRHVIAESPFSEKFIRSNYPEITVRAIDYPLRQEYLNSQPSTGMSPRVIFVGRITPEKGVYDCLSAFASVAPKEWTLHVVGAGTIEQERNLKGLAGSLGLSARFRHDHSLSLPELVAALQASSVFLLPTHIDCGPTALKEAVVMGLWPVCYDNSGPACYIRQWGWGTLAADRQVEDLTTVLKSVLANKPWMEEPRRSRFVAEMRQYYHNEKTWIRLKDYYRWIMDEGSQA